MSATGHFLPKCFFITQPLPVAHFLSMLVDKNFVDVVEDNGKQCLYTQSLPIRGQGLRTRRDGDAVLTSLLTPVTAASFFESYWEKRCLLVQRPRKRSHFSSLFSLAAFKALVDSPGLLHYGTSLDVTRYSAQADSEGRETLNEQLGGAVDPSAAWELFRANGCSLRLLHPQRWADAVARVLAGVELSCGSTAGCNAYLTPAGSQGFAPHFDDIDAVVLQVEGSKRWRLYRGVQGEEGEGEGGGMNGRGEYTEGDRGNGTADRSDDEDALEFGEVTADGGGLAGEPSGPAADQGANGGEGNAVPGAPGRWLDGSGAREWPPLPRFSSRDFERRELLEPPILEVVLEPGDVLYMPRGTIHQAESCPSSHSLHLTVSFGQRNTFADLLQLALPRALELAVEAHPSLRQGLPRDLFAFAGVMHADEHGEPRRAAFLKHVRQCLELVLQECPVDGAVDQMAVGFLQSRLPAGGLDSAGKKRKKRGAVEQAESVRVSVEGGTRLVVEDDDLVLYHMMSNRRSTNALHQQAECAKDTKEGNSVCGRLVFKLEDAEVIEAVLRSEESIKVAELLELSEHSVRVYDLLRTLYAEGVLELV